MPRPVSLASLATAVPPHRVTQREGGGGRPWRLRGPLRRFRPPCGRVRDLGDPHPSSGAPGRMVSATARLGGPQRRLSRSSRGPVHRGRHRRTRTGLAERGRGGHGGDDLLDRNRHAQSRGARGRQDGVPERPRTRPGLRPRLRGRRLRARPRGTPRRRAAGQHRPRRGGRALLAVIPARPADEGEHRRDGAVRRRGGSRGAAGRRRAADGRDGGPALLAADARHHGLACRRRRARRDLRPGDPALRRGPCGRGHRGDPRPRGADAGGGRPLCLPSRRSQGHHGARTLPVARAGHARSRARGAGPEWQHVRADRSLRARARAERRAATPHPPSPRWGRASPPAASRFRRRHERRGAPPSPSSQPSGWPNCGSRGATPCG